MISKIWIQALAVHPSTYNWVRSTVKLVDQRQVDLAQLGKEDNAKHHQHLGRSLKALISTLARITRTYWKLDRRGRKYYWGIVLIWIPRMLVSNRLRTFCQSNVISAAELDPSTKENRLCSHINWRRALRIVM